MYATVDKKVLKDCMAQAKYLITRKGPQGIMLSSDGPHEPLQLRATDGESLYLADMPACINAPGKYVLDFSATAAALDRAPDRITINGSFAGLPLAPVDPERGPHLLPLCATMTSFGVDDLAKHLRRTVCAASTDPKWPWLAVVCFHVHADRVWLATTDGHRLALSRTVAPPAAFRDLPNERFCISRKSASALMKIVPKGADIIVTIRGREKPEYVSFAWGSESFETPVIDVDYPPVWQYVPTDPPGITVDRKSFVAALAAMRKIKADTVAINFTEGRVEPRSLTGYDPVKWASSFQRLSSNSELDFTAGFNLKYLIAAAGVDTPSLALHMSGPSDPLMVTASDFLALVMPMRL